MNFIEQRFAGDVQAAGRFHFCCHCCQQAWDEILGILPYGVREGLDTFG